MNEMQSFKQVLLLALGFDLENPPVLDDETPLFGDQGLGLDSIDAMAISTAVKAAYGVNLEAYASMRPVFLANCKALMDFIRARLHEQDSHDQSGNAARSN